MVGDDAVLEVVKGTYSVKEGISQILFVISSEGRIGKEDFANTYSTN